MVKVYSTKGKLIVYLPYDVVKELKLQGNEEVEFIRQGNAFIFAKKSDAAQLPASAREAAQQRPKEVPKGELSYDELTVLKKLDTIRYTNRTEENVGKVLSQDEKEILRRLIAKRHVSTYKKDKNTPVLYGISKDIYNRFLMRKKGEPPVPQPKQVTFHLKRKPGSPENENINKLEENGFVVLGTEAEAATLSLALEESIRLGMVLGTRAFNKKFYILLRAFIERNSGSIINRLKEGPKRVPELSGSLGLDEEGVRGILYMLAEAGDVSEKRRDLFALA